MSADQITAIGTCVIAAATVAGIVVAILGLKTWRVQLEGSAHFDLARRMILEVYRVRDALERVRTPLMLVAEATGADPDVPWEISVYERRWQGVLDVQAPLEVCAYESRILWGDEAENLMHRLKKQTASLYLAVSAFARSKRGEGNDLDQEQRAVLYAGIDEDSFAAELQAVVEGFEACVRPHLPRQGSAQRTSR